MPSTFAHHYYGWRVYSILPKTLQNDIKPYLPYYHIGVHGPDILFYPPSPHHALSEQGMEIHHESGKVFFEKALKTIKNQKEKPEAKAYLLGFLTHFMLDSSCHPLINQTAKKTGISHTELETDLDTYLLSSLHLPPQTKKTRKIYPGLSMGKVIAPYYGLLPREIVWCILWQKIMVDSVFRSPYPYKKNLILAVGKQFSSLSSLSNKIGVWEKHYNKTPINSKTQETITILHQTLNNSLEECKSMMVALSDALRTEENDFLQLSRLQVDFSGKIPKKK